MVVLPLGIPFATVFLTAGLGRCAPRGRDSNDQEVAFMTRSRRPFAALLIAGTVLTLAPSISSAQYFRVWGPGTSYLGNLSPNYGYYSSPIYGYYGSPTFGYYGSPTFGNYASPNYGYYANPNFGYYSSPTYVDRNYGYYYSPTYVSPDYGYYGSMYPAYVYSAADYPTNRSYGYGYYNPGNSLNWSSYPTWGNNTSNSYPRTARVPVAAARS
jgi:hypothetical protein